VFLKEEETVAVENIAGSHSGGIVVIDGGTVRVVRSAAFEAPKAAVYLGALPDELRQSAIEDLLEHGVAAAMLAQSSAHVVVLEAKVGELAAQLGANLDKRMKEAGADQAKVMQEMLLTFNTGLAKLVAPLTDVNARDGLPAKMLDLLELSNRHAMKQWAALVNDPDEGVMAKAVKQISDQVKETGLAITRAIAADQALRKSGVRRGGAFEEVVAARLPVLAMGVGRIEHCSRTPGDKANNTGDYVIVLEGYQPELKIAVEAKSQKTHWSQARIQQELKAARSNRGAVAGILVADSAEMLPGKVGFGQVSPFDYFVALDPEVGDDTALACAIYMARVTAVSTVALDAGDQVDIPAAQREVAVMRGLLEAFSKFEASGTKINREVDSIRTVADELKAELLATLRRLDAILSA
jgi:hypothetical protein